MTEQEVIEAGHYPQALEAGQDDTLSLLSEGESQTLTRCEAVIKEGLDSFIKVGQALCQIHDSRLYRQQYPTFEAYLRENWGFSKSHAARLVSAAGIVQQIETSYLQAEGVSPVGDNGEKILPINESQARPLSALPEDQRVEAWSKAVEKSDGQPTAAVVQEVVAEMLPAKPETVPPAHAPLLDAEDSGSENGEAGKDHESSAASDAPGPLTEPLRVGDIVCTNYQPQSHYKIITIGETQQGDAHGVDFVAVDADNDKSKYKDSDYSYLNGYSYENGRCLGYSNLKGSWTYGAITKAGDTADTDAKRNEILLVIRASKGAVTPPAPAPAGTPQPIAANPSTPAPQPPLLEKPALFVHPDAPHTSARWDDAERTDFEANLPALKIARDFTAVCQGRAMAVISLTVIDQVRAVIVLDALAACGITLSEWVVTKIEQGVVFGTEDKPDFIAAVTEISQMPVAAQVRFCAECLMRSELDQLGYQQEPVMLRFLMPEEFASTETVLEPEETAEPEASKAPVEKAPTGKLSLWHYHGGKWELMPTSYELYTGAKRIIEREGITGEWQWGTTRYFARWNSDVPPPPGYIAGFVPTIPTWMPCADCPEVAPGVTQGAATEHVNDFGNECERGQGEWVCRECARARQEKAEAEVTPEAEAEPPRRTRAPREGGPQGFTAGQRVEVQRWAYRAEVWVPAVMIRPNYNIFEVLLDGKTKNEWVSDDNVRPVATDEVAEAPAEEWAYARPDGLTTEQVDAKYCTICGIVPVSEAGDACPACLDKEAEALA